MKEELFKIGEVAKLFNISVSTLRYYEKLGLVIPEEVDRDTGYRYYSTDQFEALNTLRYLRLLDTPLESIQEFYKGRDVDKMKTMLEVQKKELRDKITALEKLEKKVGRRLDGIEEARAKPLNIIEEIKNSSLHCRFLLFFGYFCIEIEEKMFIYNWLYTFGKYLTLMGRVFSQPERMRMFFKKYVKEMQALGVDSIGIVLLISFFIGAVICIQMKINIESPWMPRWVAGYTTREIMLLEFSSSIMCLILAGKVGSNIASELGTMRVTQQIDALEIMGVNSAEYLILPKITAMVTMMPFLVIFSSAMGIVGAYATAYIGHIMSPDDLTLGIQHAFVSWFLWMSVIKSLFFAFIIASVSSYCGYTVEGGSVEVGEASTSAVVTSSVLILFSDVFLTQLLS